MKHQHVKGAVPPGSKSPDKGITRSAAGKPIYPPPKPKVIYA